MKRIKKFFEMFDDDSLKAKHEIDWISGKLDNLGKKVDRNFNRKENIKNLISKLSGRNFPFFAAFDAAVKSPTGDLEFNKDVPFKINTRYDEETKFCSFVAEDEEDLVVLNIKINKTNDYDVSVMKSKQEEDSDDYDGYEYQNVNYDGLVDIIVDVYLKYIADCEFTELTHYDYGKYKEINN